MCVCVSVYKSYCAIKTVLISYRYWLFGEKEQKGENNVGSKRIRGWFPRPCVIEVIENDLYDSDNLFKDN